MITNDGSVCVLGTCIVFNGYRNKCSFLHYIDKSLVLQIKGEKYLQHYDLITGNMINIQLPINNQSIICSDDKKIYIVSSSQSLMLTLTVLNKEEYYQPIKVCKTKSFNISNKIKNKSFKE